MMSGSATSKTLELWLLRHAQAKPTSPSGYDRDRPLSPLGFNMCATLNHWLTDHLKSHPAPKTIGYSPAVRTRQTIEQVMADLPLPAPQPMERLWAASAGDLVALITEWADAPGPIWLVGHNPGLSDLVSWLARPLPAPGMKPGTLVRLSIEHPLHPGVGEILEVVQTSESV